MNKSPNVRRSRGRGAKRSKGNNLGNRGDTYRVKGNPKQLIDKYKTLARDALQSGDRVLAEYYFQHADHYQRILNERHGPPVTSHDEDGEDEAMDSPPQDSRRHRSRSQRAAEADIADRPQPSPRDDTKSRSSGDDRRQEPAEGAEGGSEAAAPKPRRRRSRKQAEEDTPEAVAD